jgi:hypothetical protein
MHFLQAINSDPSVLIVCNKTGGTIKGDIKKKDQPTYSPHFVKGNQEIKWKALSSVVHIYGA